MKQKYTKPTANDINGVNLAVGGCNSGHYYPNRCNPFGGGNGTECADGVIPLTPPPSCAPGNTAQDCATGTLAGA
jgi:hypothetical protein